MQLGIIGMGKMGLPLALNARDKGVEVVVFTENEEKLNQLTKKGISAHGSLESFIGALTSPRVVWMMIPAGEPVEVMISRLRHHLAAGDIIIDGGNSRYQDSQRRGEVLRRDNIHFLDVGTSGGTEGARNGACLMVGGNKSVYAGLELLFKALSGGMGYGWMGDSGAGHFVKMIHNGIEYGMMQAIAEGLEILRHGPLPFKIDQVTSVWRRGSIVSGLLMDMTSDALAREPDLESIEGIVAASGEANWTVEEAIRLGVATPVIATALFTRFKSQDKEKYAEKSLAAMRREFGGHPVVTRNKE